MTKNTKNGLFVLLLTVGVLLSCAPSSVLVETNYEIGQPLVANVGDVMIVIRASSKRSFGDQLAQGMANQPVIRSESFTRTLTYTGKNESTIKIAYREFSGVNNLENARPAYSLDLEYDLLPAGNTPITYRDIQIEVIDATSSQIEFKVINDNGLTGN